MSVFQSQFARHQLLSSVAIISVAIATPAMAQSKSFNIPSMPVKDAAAQVARTAQVQVLVTDRAAKGRKSNRLVGDYTVEQAFQEMLKDTGLTYTQSGPQTFVIKAETARPAVAAPMMFAPTVAAAVQAEPQYDEIIVTAQKKEERITDVPIAMSAFSAEALDNYKIEGGSELLRAIPNVNFSKSNFSMYNFSIRGIGTKAISASSDPAVAISYNNTPLVRNRLFESEFYDIERIEVLRGPQGTLYGRNATAGVVNIIPKEPTDNFEGYLKGEVGNFTTKKISGAINIPVSSNLFYRISGALTKRDGYDYNIFTQKKVNDRDLWSTRLGLNWLPSDYFSATFSWQRFNENDQRSRTGKQLCTRDEGPEDINGIAISNEIIRGRLSQGCMASTIYSDAAYGKANGNILSYMVAASNFVNLGFPLNSSQIVPVVRAVDVYGTQLQSRNLREIETAYDPKFKAKNDIYQFNMNFHPSEKIVFNYQGSFSKDYYYSTQDYNRSLSEKAFNDSSLPLRDAFGQLINTELFPGITPGGVYCDEIIGLCSDRVIGIDLSLSRNKQWYHEIRLRSDLNGRINFIIGSNYLDFKTTDKYYVVNNIFNILSKYMYGSVAPNPNNPAGSAFGSPTPRKLCDVNTVTECVGYEGNPLDKLNDLGHNYFLSKNLVNTKSYAVFGEFYYKFNEDINITLGLRYTKDRKISSQIPSQLLLGNGGQFGGVTGGRVNWGYPALDDIEQDWNALTGRFVLDWKPSVSFSDDTLVYFSYSRGYKGGGTNPPRVDINESVVQYLPLENKFKPEYVNSFEIGMKNMLKGQRASLNINAFFYDYKDYQISQITDRISLNENFGANVYGVEFEGFWRPTRALRVDANIGFLQTRVKKGNRSIDVMDRTNGNSEWQVVRPWLQVPSNCIAPKVLIEKILLRDGANVDFNAISALCPGSSRYGHYNPAYPLTRNFDIRYGFTWDPSAPYNPDTIGLNIDQGGSGAPNGGRGFAKDLSGNSLPNSPSLTINTGIQYSFDIKKSNWIFDVRSDFYYQSRSYARIYNTGYDRVKSWSNVNLTFNLKKINKDINFSLYIKNVFGSSPITDIFTNSDDTGLNANVFTLDPRIIGFSIAKSF